VLIDRRVRRDMLSELAASRWGQAQPARKAWIEGLMREAAA
jgi:hypothetical protein